MNAACRLLLAAAFCFAGAGMARADHSNSVERGLSWLVSQQRADGSWSENPALNALPMLAMLAAGRTPGVKPYTSPLDRGLRFILTQATPEGAFTGHGGRMYGHGITTWLLAETCGMTRDDRFIRPALQRSVRVILQAQAVEKGTLHEGGWRYEPSSTDSDLSVSVWQITALKAASAAGIVVPRAALERAGRYLKRCEHPSGGFGYQPGGIPNHSRTAAAVVALRLSGWWKDPAIGRAQRWLEKNPLRWESDYFYHAVAHLAHAGVPWDPALLLNHQERDGSWPAAPNAHGETKAGPLYTTSMAVLALTAEWHYLPALME